MSADNYVIVDHDGTYFLVLEGCASNDTEPESWHRYNTEAEVEKHIADIGIIEYGVEWTPAARAACGAREVTAGDAPVRIVEVSPAFDRRDPDPSKNYGIHGAEIKFILKGPAGAAQFVICTNWMLPHVQKEIGPRKGWTTYCAVPMGADVGYHSPVPMYEDQEPIAEECPYLDGRPCYYDGSGLRAEELLERMIEEGDSAVWRELERVYSDLPIAREEGS